MNPRTFLSLIRNQDLSFLLRLSRDLRRYYRFSFVAGGLSSGWLKKLAPGPRPLAALAVDLALESAYTDGLEAWLQMGVALGELRSGAEGYSLRGRLSRKLVDPANDAIAAVIEEAATIDNFLITQSPNRLSRRQRLTLADQDARLVARSSRIIEPFICEAMDAAIPCSGAIKLFEIGCGSAAYIRHAALRNKDLTALGLELQPAAAELASENIARWNLAARVTIEVGDVLGRNPEPVFDIVTLHQNIYYFPVEKRVGVLRHVRGFLKAGGRLLITTFCQGYSMGSGLLDLWGALTEGCGRLPTSSEMVAQLGQAGFGEVTDRSLIPGENFYSFLGTSPSPA